LFYFIALGVSAKEGRYAEGITVTAVSGVTDMLRLQHGSGGLSHFISMQRRTVMNAKYMFCDASQEKGSVAV
jgi:hypothetical protein